MSRLAGKVAIIIGGAGGIGLAAGKRFADEGAQMLLVDCMDKTWPTRVLKLAAIR